MRRRLSCPDCGWTAKYGEYNNFKTKMEFENDGFTCPNCLSIYNNEDFWAENIFKWSKDADFENEVA